MWGLCRKSTNKNKGYSIRISKDYNILAGGVRYTKIKLLCFLSKL